MKVSFLRFNINQYVCFAIFLLLMLIIPITQFHKIIGIDLSHKSDSEEQPTVVVTDDGAVVVNTTDIAKDIIGYVGPTPMEIRIKDGVIQKVTPLPNKETPEFFGAVTNSDILDRFEGLTLPEAADLKVDAVSGATFTSNAVINTVKAGVVYALAEGNIPAVEKKESQPIDAKWIATIVIILCGALIPLWYRSKAYRTVQLLLNVAVLGLWGGAFLSYSIMVSALTNGLWRVILIPVALMLVVAFIYPMFGKVNHYCNWICPYGSLQELLGKCIPWKLRISQRVGKWLTVFRQVLWFGLMWLLWTGLWFDWMGYEPFAAFFFNDASWAVLMIAGVFLLLSLVVQRPYCRFVCPTGTLFHLSSGNH